MNFEKAVGAAPYPVNGAFRPGKQALENRHRNKINCGDPQRLTRSINLDEALAREVGYANQPRWDYGLGYLPIQGREQAVWVEVHTATTGEVRAVLKKLQWLLDWLNGEAEILRRLTNRANINRRFIWVASAGVKISKNSPQARQLNSKGVRLTGHLMLP